MTRIPNEAARYPDPLGRTVFSEVAFFHRVRQADAAQEGLHLLRARPEVVGMCDRPDVHPEDLLVAIAEKVAEVAIYP